MIHIKRLDEMIQSLHRVNESSGNEGYLEFFGKMVGMYDLHKFDKLCPDLDYGESEFKSTLQELGVNVDVDIIAKAYYESIFHTYVADLIENHGVTEDEAERIEMDFNPVEFHFDDEYFETTDELMAIISRKRGENGTSVRENLNESRDLHIQKAEVKPYYVIKRLHRNRKGNFEWLDENGVYNTVESAEAQIKLIGTQGVRGATNRFQIVMEQPVEIVDCGDPRF